MPSIIKDLLLAVALAAVVAGVALGSIYAKRSIQNGKQSDVLIRSRQRSLEGREKSVQALNDELAAAKALLAAETARLAAMQGGPDAFSSVFAAIADFGGGIPVGQSPAATAAVARLDGEVRRIEAMIAGWKSLSATDQSARKTGTAAIQDAIVRLAGEVSALTPAGSGFTQAQVDALAAAVSAMENAFSAESSSSVSTVAVTSVSSAELQAGRDAVEAAAAQVASLEAQLSQIQSTQPAAPAAGQTGDADGTQTSPASGGQVSDRVDAQVFGSGGTSTADSGTGFATGGAPGGNSQGTYSPPPPPPDQTGKPRLIQGTNSF